MSESYDIKPAPLSPSGKRPNSPLIPTASEELKRTDPEKCTSDSSACICILDKVRYAAYLGLCYFFLLGPLDCALSLLTSVFSDVG